MRKAQAVKITFVLLHEIISAIRNVPELSRTYQAHETAQPSYP
jgi:hypothetical protein